MAIDPFKGYRQDMSNLAGSMQYRNEQQRQAPLDASVIARRAQVTKQASLRNSVLEQQIGDDAEMRALGASTAGMPTKKRAGAWADALAGQGRFKDAVDLTSKISETDAAQRDRMFQILQTQGLEAAKADGLASGMEQAEVDILDTVEVTEDLISHKTGNGTVIHAKDPTTGGYKTFFLKDARPTGGGGSTTNPSTYGSKVQELSIGENKDGASMFQKFQFNPETQTYDRPMGEPYAKGSFASQVNELSDDAIDDKAFAHVVGDKAGKVTGGRVSALANQRIANRASELRNDLGIAEGAIISKPEEFKAYGKSLSQQEKQIGAMGSYIENMQHQIVRYDELAKEIETYDARLLNVPLRTFRAKVAGHPLQAKLDTYITEISTEMAKIASGATGSVKEVSDSAREKWDAIHDKNLSIKDMSDLLHEIGNMANLRMRSVQNERTRTVEKIQGLVEKPKAAAHKPPEGSVFGLVNDEEGYQFDGKMFLLDGTEVE